jgi:hypothetical protein
MLQYQWVQNTETDYSMNYYLLCIKKRQRPLLKIHSLLRAMGVLDFLFGYNNWNFLHLLHSVKAYFGDNFLALA